MDDADDKKALKRALAAVPNVPQMTMVVAGESVVVESFLPFGTHQ